jgi:hypothetical protein
MVTEFVISVRPNALRTQYVFFVDEVRRPWTLLHPVAALRQCTAASPRFATTGDFLRAGRLPRHFLPPYELPSLSPPSQPTVHRSLHSVAATHESPAQACRLPVAATPKSPFRSIQSSRIAGVNQV